MHLNKAERWVLEYCTQPRTMHEIMHGALGRMLEDRGVKLPRDYTAWWAYLREVTNGLLRKGILSPDERGKIVIAVETPR